MAGVDRELPMPKPELAPAEVQARVDAGDKAAPTVDADADFPDLASFDIDAISADFGDVEQPPAGGEQPSAQGTDEPVAPTTEAVAEEKPADGDAPQQGEEEEQAPVPLTPEQAVEFRNTIFAGLEKHYAMSDDEASAFAADVKTELPKVLAKVHYTAVESATVAMLSMLPKVIENFQKRQTAVTQSANDFFTRWPSLKPHVKQVAEVAKIWRAQHPDASRKDFIEGVGKYVTAMLPPTRESLPPPRTAGSTSGAPRVQQQVPAGQEDWAALAELEV